MLAQISFAQADTAFRLIKTFPGEIADAAIEYLRPFQERVKQCDDASLEAILKSGAEKARSIASVTLADVYEKTGIR